MAITKREIKRKQQAFDLEGKRCEEGGKEEQLGQMGQGKHTRVILVRLIFKLLESLTECGEPQPISRLVYFSLAITISNLNFSN